MKPIILAILDGWGYARTRGGNPIQEATKPNFDLIEKQYPMVLLQASGLAVGLHWGEFGNSEVGHLTIGAGRIMQQYSTRISNAIKDGSFQINQVIAEVFTHPRIHLVGLLTSGTVHASFEHILALIKIGQQQHREIMLHLFTDGKDSGLQEAAALLEKLQLHPTTLIGRDFGMDRDNNWELTRQAAALITRGTGEPTEDFSATLSMLYSQGLHDDKIPALKTPSYDGLHESDSVFFFNFREDSMRQIYSLFPGAYSMTKYTDNDTHFAFDALDATGNLSEVISAQGKRQLHIAETSKYAHVTYFFNGLRENAYPGEEDVFLVSPKDIVADPPMKALEIAERIVSSLQNNSHDFIVANFANPDMLAHTGNFEATKLGVEAVDAAIGSIMAAAFAADATLFITADHANAEELVDKITNAPQSRHGIGPVPLYLVGKEFQISNDKLQMNEEPAGILADVAPTILELMQIPQPSEMTGKSLLPVLLGRST